ncbi:hypothetical protein MERGE_000862 [Pneumocystis wakefieldiae]|uniref:Cytidyltransferase-like domain-containing protein n=1 Tax=Pneumocystis wakefieldiae TaxID=38082 RepID=A0A899G2V3_9ASCO|nr:hypothetical protein MERGE_000862 [Pneumocystis wakefieldiae]
MSENSKKRHNKADLEVNIVFNEWCGYELFSEQKNWDKIYTLKDDKPLIDRISSLNSLQSRLFILSDQPASQEFLLKKGAKRCVREPNNESFGYKYVAVGGTFDHLHAGHKILLAMSAWISEENVVCGVTDKVLLKNKKYAELIEPNFIFMGAIVVSQETIAGELDIFCICIISDQIDSEMMSVKISSTSIRKRIAKQSKVE